MDEYTFGRYQDRAIALATLTTHWNTFITEDDFRQIAEAGLSMSPFLCGLSLVRPLRHLLTETARSPRSCPASDRLLGLRRLRWGALHPRSVSTALQARLFAEPSRFSRLQARSPSSTRPSRGPRRTASRSWYVDFGLQLYLRADRRAFVDRPSWRAGLAERLRQRDLSPALSDEHFSLADTLPLHSSLVSVAARSGQHSSPTSTAPRRSSPPSPKSSAILSTLESSRPSRS